MSAVNRLVTLGTKGGPAVRKGGAMPTSTLLELDGRRIVIDCGIGVTRALVEAGMDLKTLDLIFITHLHSDHLLELGPLLHTAWTSGLKTPVTIYGPEGIAGYWAAFLQSMSYDTAIRVYDEGRPPLDGLVRVQTYIEGPVLDGPLRVGALRVPHPPLDPCYALRFDGSRSVTCSGDTAYHLPLADFARGSDLLLHEAMLPEAVDLIVQKTGMGEKLRAHIFAAHTTADDAARIAAAAGVGRLVLNHLLPADDPRFTEGDWLAKVAQGWDGPTMIARDGLEILL
ncbi:MAG: MBL fold metallo-hydrolase [Limimaricola sp.]|uniref:MBL fold metallo-hydrolase n=1 Tax=Limimaricola sp. TaxID=2211665 RepID=UPI001DC5115A|nr:MBL fold metallo-hydrolase [Limimaricola sp.]MBI1417563.1 MBL fold metallo-hydrolase [Limimaricola sp.]